MKEKLKRDRQEVEQPDIYDLLPFHFPFFLSLFLLSFFLPSFPSYAIFLSLSLFLSFFLSPYFSISIYLSLLSFGPILQVVLSFFLTFFLLQFSKENFESSYLKGEKVKRSLEISSKALHCDVIFKDLF